MTLTASVRRITVVIKEGDAPECPRCGTKMGLSLKGWWKGYCHRCKTPFEVTTE